MARGAARATPSGGAIEGSVGLCGFGHHGPQLMRMSLGRFNRDHLMRGHLKACVYGLVALFGRVYGARLQGRWSKSATESMVRLW
jgi:hypothetical protein